VSLDVLSVVVVVVVVVERQVVTVHVVETD
jgi:hypothetical protein